MAKPNHPLNEVFGFPPSDFSPAAQRNRQNRLCPFNNRVPNCTKDRANDPLGVCPIRFRQDWLVAEDAASFFFPEGTAWTMTELVIGRDLSWLRA
ncbi:MAG: NotI family restriction endonuclease [Anaerolineae bacterium]